MSSDGFPYVGTVRNNNLCKELKGKVSRDKELGKIGRGAHDVRVGSSTSIICVKWQDTKAVTMMCNCVGPEPFDKVRRWDKSMKEYIEVNGPFIVKDYNSYMGGVDMLDAHVARCTFCPRT